MTPGRNVSSDERGAMMLLALFFAIFALALLYTVIGAAQASFFRERMQDAADSVALSSAIMHARSMNLIVLINILMAALLAILVTIKLIQGLTIIGMAIAAALSWITFGASLAAVPPLQVIQSEMQELYDTTKTPVFQALEILHDVADAVKTAGPLAAAAAASADVGYWRPQVESGVVVPGSLTLPVEDDTFKHLCNKAGTLPAGIAGNVLEPIGVKPVFDALSGAIGDMTESLSEWFCGDDGQSPKPFPYSTEPVYPTTETTKDCLASKPDTKQAEGATTKACEKARKVEKQSRPDPHTGGCNEEADCSLNGPYDMRVRDARTECDPTGPHPPEKYFYQARHGTVPYFWTGKGWIRGESEYKSPSSEESTRAPCAPKPYDSTIGSTYNTVVRKSDDVTDVDPVCSDEQPPLAVGASPGETKSVSFVEVRHILGCQKVVQKEVNLDVSGGPAGSSSSGEKTPKQVLATATLGDDSFQVRALMRGDFSVLGAERIVNLALWGRKPPTDPLSGLKPLGKFSVAQAEYFYDGNDGRDAWMWNMSWRARLRRFRIPGGEAGNLGEACGALCSDVLGQMSGLSGLIAH